MIVGAILISFCLLSLGIFLVGVACVKDAFRKDGR